MAEKFSPVIYAVITLFLLCCCATVYIHIRYLRHSAGLLHMLLCGRQVNNVQHYH